jgi:hypothetical protein
MDRQPMPRVGAHRSSASGRSDARELRPRGGGGAVGGVDAGAPFYRVGGGAGRSGIGEEWAVKVVRHNGDEGSRFGRGSGGE